MKVSENAGALPFYAPAGKRGVQMFKDRLKELRKAAGYTQASLSAQVGVSQQAVGKWERGKSSPDPDTLAALAKLFGVSTDDLLGQAPPPAVPGMLPGTPYGLVGIPVVGTVRAGYGALAYEEDYGTEPASVKDPSSYFYLVVRGSSMEPRIREGDLALVHKQPTLDSGDLGVMVYGEGEGTLKRYLVRGSSVILQPFNPDYEEKVLNGEELDHLYIVGKVVKTVSQW